MKPRIPHQIARVQTWRPFLENHSKTPTTDTEEVQGTNTTLGLTHPCPVTIQIDMYNSIKVDRYNFFETDTDMLS